MVVASKVDQLVNNVQSNSYKSRSLVEWRPELARQCCCFVCGESYLCRRFDQINYVFATVDQAKEIVIDNLYSILRYKYLTKRDDETEKRIQEIVKSFTVNLKSSLQRVSFDPDDVGCHIVSFLEDGQIAFRNGVFDFRTNSWVFKYDITDIPELNNLIYDYDPDKIIAWYLNINFDPLPLNISEFSLDEFANTIKVMNTENQNYCWQLLYNMSHDEEDKFSLEKFYHLCEIIGFSCCNNFVQSVVLFIGSGSNGKNSLFDGCFTGKVIPRPSSVSLDDIENDRFVTGSLENHWQNIYLETSAKTYTESRVLKNITGSMYQMIEQKGVQKYNSIINTHMIFSGNSQDKIKFSDTTNGFRRRINIYEVYYQWDSKGRFLEHGDYYNPCFSDDLRELKNDNLNVITYLYFAMYGIARATKNFTQSFKFSRNDWRTSYSDIDFELKDKIEHLRSDDLLDYISRSARLIQESKNQLFDIDGVPLCESPTMKELGVHNSVEMFDRLHDEEFLISYFADHDAYISLTLLKALVQDFSTNTAFSQAVKKIYGINKFESFKDSRQNLKFNFHGNKFRIIP